MYRIIVRRNYVSGKEYNPGDYLEDANGLPLEFESGADAMEYARKHEGVHVCEDGVLDWWKDIKSV